MPRSTLIVANINQCMEEVERTGSVVNDHYILMGMVRNAPIIMIKFKT